MKKQKMIMYAKYVGFRLLMELYSFLPQSKEKALEIARKKFLSPYGVIFILTQCYQDKQFLINQRFRLLMEYHSFLFGM